MFRYANYEGIVKKENNDQRTRINKKQTMIIGIFSYLGNSLHLVDFIMITSSLLYEGAAMTLMACNTNGIKP